MELRQYWNVIWRRKWLVLGIVLLAGLLSGYVYFTTQRTFETQVRFITRQEPTPDNPGAPGIIGSAPDMVFTFNRYYNWFGSEFLVDDYTQITASDAFAASVLATMKEPFFANKVMEDLNKQIQEATKPGDPSPKLHGEPDVVQLEDKISKLTALDIKNGIESDRRHRELRLIITAKDDIVAKAIADASGAVLADASMKPIQGKMVDDKGVFTQIDRVGPANTTPNRGKEILNAIIRVIIGLAAAVAFAFLLEYLDNSLRDERDAARVLELPVLGAIPRV
jgi:capsular polysaccharide biosynthesis protein